MKDVLVACKDITINYCVKVGLKGHQYSSYAGVTPISASLEISII